MEPLTGCARGAVQGLLADNETFPLLLDPHSRVGGCGRALPTKTQVKSGTSQSKSGTSVHLSNSGYRARVPRQGCSWETRSTIETVFLGA